MVARQARGGLEGGGEHGAGEGCTRYMRGIGPAVCHDDGELEQIMVVVSLSFRRGIFQSRESLGHARRGNVKSSKATKRQGGRGRGGVT